MQPLPRRVGRAVEERLRRHVRAGREIQKGAVAIVDGLTGQAPMQDLHRNLCPAARLLRIAQKLHFYRVLRAEQRIVRRFDKMRVERVVPERKGKTKRTQKGALRPRPAFYRAAAKPHDERRRRKNGAQDERPLRGQ